MDAFMVKYLKGKDVRRAHSGQTVAIGQSEFVVIVGKRRDFVSAFGILGVGQEGVLEPGHEFALRTPRSLAL